MSFIEESECPCQKRRAGRARPTTWRRRRRGEVDGVRGTIGFLVGSTCQPHAHHCWRSCGEVGAPSKAAPVGIWTLALTFRREGLSVLDVAFVAADAFPPKRRCSITGPLLDELLLANFLGPLLTANLRAPPYLTLFATDASPSAAGACSSAVSLEEWTKLYDLREDRGESVRLDWRSCPPVETGLRDSRASAAFLTVGLPFSFRFRAPQRQHIHVLELEALIRLVQRLADRGTVRVRPLVLVDSRVVLGAVSKGRSL